MNGLSLLNVIDGFLDGGRTLLSHQAHTVRLRQHVSFKLSEHLFKVGKEGLGIGSQNVHLLKNLLVEILLFL